MSEQPRDDEQTPQTIEAPAAPVVVPVLSGLQTLDLGAAIGMVCDIDDSDCNPMAFAGTDGAPAMTGGADEA